MAVAVSTYQADIKFSSGGRQCTCNVLMAFVNITLKNVNCGHPMT